ncbi:hypothetical protein CA85_00510 [Allorhodopirellula solitaria]|uniref:Uncharacterized protein n=1 Tax=Allorhodopirellula solitaria TaxID=2527987 RepID=A0A5C5YIS0_9BACT|nr:hypothetical protein CA85_00510 [Allorhodopirellula solitaria]
MPCLSNEMAGGFVFDDANSLQMHWTDRPPTYTIKAVGVPKRARNTPPTQSTLLIQPPAVDTDSKSPVPPHHSPPAE